MVRAPPKALKLGKALKTAAKLPVRVPSLATGRGGRNTFSPLVGESPVVVLRVQVIGCHDLLAKDRNGASDPFVVVSVLSRKQHTPVAKRTLNPTYPAKEATFDFPIYLSLAEKLGVVELVIWDKDMLRKDYLGEVGIPLEDWFRDDNAYDFNDPDNKPFTFNVVSTRTSTHATGTIQVKLGFVQPPDALAARDFRDIYADLVKLSRPSLVSAPPTEGIGTIRSHEAGPEFEDDGLSSDEGESSTDIEDEEEVAAMSRLRQGVAPLAASDSVLPPPSPTLDDPQMTPTTSSTMKTPIASADKRRSPSFTKKFLRRPSSKRSSSLDSSMVPSALSVSPSTPNLPSGGITPPLTPPGAVTARPSAAAGKARFRKSWGVKSKDYNFSPSHDIIGIVMLEIEKATDLPKLKNMTRTGWDMDPFVVISFGKKVFRTRVIRHSLNPHWDEKLLFHVRRYESAFQVHMAVLDWDKLSSNDHVGSASFSVSELLAKAPKKDEKTGLYPEDNDGTQDSMQDFVLPLQTEKSSPWEAKHHPVLTVRAKYQPYDALRQRFWRQYLKQYDTDDSGTISRLELTSMLDSLGSTLSRQTVDSFFTRFDKRPDEVLTVDEAIQCLETELCRPPSERKRIDGDDAALDTSAPVTPNVLGGTHTQFDLNLDKLDFSGPPQNIPAPDPEPLRKPAQPAPQPTEPMQQPLHEVATITRTSSPRIGFERQVSTASSDAEDSSGSVSGSGSNSPASDDGLERVINVKSCPLCHRPRMNAKAEVDIVTHMAVCASQDWARVDRIVVGNFVTASQAQRKWYTKVISKVSSGDYRLGANSANIIVQNRITGQLEEEKMQVYVRLGIRLLYKGWKGRMEGARARRLLKSLSIKQGVKYDSPESARDIPAFIEFHKLKVDEILRPIDEFKTFNEFFYRELKPDARPVENPDDPYRLVSGADCRLMVFETVNEATRLWIKGRDFSVQRLLGEAYAHEAERYNGGALCIFRLAPQDYHRFHSPVDGVIGKMTYISGEYYTVNPQAIRTALDVYGENARKIVPIDSPQFGRVMAVCIGAMMVGSIKTTVNEGDFVKRGQEFGYFAFGGSTIVVLFEKGVVEWDEDLLINGRACLETLVRVGMGIGRSHRATSP
ncbi:phosphatidylserine decarboxylase-like protein [Phanerochaete sordida]|uniref:Phosphatidylserine decarboxylase proenzyme 2 n=1 Tax=Phanerochaete sordida TaxID=48140 RepID=A0A9P3G7M8_9APHY|nr:phosphatidylserine decarboxylase-like protein [Phanerochaete sordida]